MQWTRAQLSTLNRCLLCHAPAVAQPLCAPCLNDLPHNQVCCLQCALPLPQPGLCPDCLSHPPAFQRSLAAYCYAPPIDRLITRWKHRGDERPLALLAGALTDQLRLAYGQDDWPQRLLPVPLHPLRLIRRGFHQTVQLANRLSSNLQLPSDKRTLVRVARGPSQQGLDKRARRINLRGQFEIAGPVQGLHLALVDDVMTTGSTADTLAALLLAAGANRVDVWLLARTP